MRTCAWSTDQYDWRNILEHLVNAQWRKIIIVAGAQKVRVRLLDRKVRRHDLELLRGNIRKISVVFGMF